MNLFTGILGMLLPSTMTGRAYLVQQLRLKKIESAVPKSLINEIVAKSIERAKFDSQNKLGLKPNAYFHEQFVDQLDFYVEGLGFWIWGIGEDSDTECHKELFERHGVQKGS